MPSLVIADTRKHVKSQFRDLFGPETTAARKASKEARSGPALIDVEFSRTGKVDVARVAVNRPTLHVVPDAYFAIMVRAKEPASVLSVYARSFA